MSWPISFMGRHGRLPWNWRTRIEVLLVKGGPRNLIHFCTRWIEGQRPHGFDGDLAFLATNKEWRVVQAYVDEPFQGRGLGSMIYRHALKHFGQLTTRWADHSDQARYVWESLIAEYQYKTDFFSGELTVFNRRRRTKKG